MKFSLLLIITTFTIRLQAQTTTHYIAFSITDTLSQPVVLSEYMIAVHAGKINEKDITALLQYDTENKFYLLAVDEQNFASLIRIDIHKKLSPADQTTVTLDLSTRFHASAGFNHLLLLNIPLMNKRMVTDMPTQDMSWQFVPTAKKKINGSEIEFRDITFMQNWNNQ